MGSSESNLEMAIPWAGASLQYFA